MHTQFSRLLWFSLSRSNSIQPARLEVQNEMLLYEADSKTRRYFGGNIPETQVGALIFDKNCQFEGRRVCYMINRAGGR